MAGVCSCVCCCRAGCCRVDGVRCRGEGSSRDEWVSATRVRGSATNGQGVNKCNNNNNKKRFYSVIRQKNRIGTASISWLALPDEPILSHKTNTRSVHIRDSEDQQWLANQAANRQPKLLQCSSRQHAFDAQRVRHRSVATPALADSVNHSPILNDIVARCRDVYFLGAGGGYWCWLLWTSGQLRMPW